MSKPMTRSSPAASEVLATATMPPAGPDRIESLPRNFAASVRPPLERMNSSGTPESSAATEATYRSRIGDR